MGQFREATYLHTELHETLFELKETQVDLRTSVKEKVQHVC